MIEFETNFGEIRLQEHEAVFSPTGVARELGVILGHVLRPQWVVCELGIGTGVLSILAGKKAAFVLGLDRNEAALSLADLNWRLNGLPEGQHAFKQSDLFSALTTEDEGKFDLIWSNPPVLPTLESVSVPSRESDRHEVSGPLGRDVLDAMLKDSQKFLKLGGEMITIATSLQGWKRTKDLLDENWKSWSVVREVEMPLTDECGPAYVEWWIEQQRAASETFLKPNKDGGFLLRLWLIKAVCI